MSRIPPKRKFNPKYHVMSVADFRASKDWLAEMAEKAVYAGNPRHKKNPGDFGLEPPCDPRPLASLCDNAGIFQRQEARHLLREAFLLGLVDSRARPGEWPKAV